MHIRAFASELARELGAGWSVIPADPERDYTFHRPNLKDAETGATFWLSEGTYGAKRGRLAVHCTWPLDHKGQEVRPYFSSHSEEFPEEPSITVASTKSPAQVAADIERRFLPAFLPMWAKQTQRVAADFAFREERHATADQLAALLLGQVSRRNGDDLPGVWLGYREHGIANVDIESDGRLNVSVRCSFAELQELVKLFPVSKGVGQ